MLKCMRITVDIDEKILDQVTKLTGEKKKGPALSKAIEEYVRRKMAAEFGRMLLAGELAGSFAEDYDPEAQDRSATA